MSEPDAGSALDTVSRDLRAPRAAGVAGLAFAVLFIASLLLLRSQPAAGSTAEEIAAWYLRTDSKHLAVVGLYFAPFAGIAFLWFIAVIRHHVGNREDQFFATVFLGSGLLFVAMLFAAAAAAGAPLAAVKFQGAPVPSADAIGLARALAYTFLYVYGVRAAAVFMIVGLDDRAPHGEPAALARDRRLRDRADHAAQRVVLPVRRAALPALGRRRQHRDPAHGARTRRAGRGVARLIGTGRIGRVAGLQPQRDRVRVPLTVGTGRSTALRRRYRGGGLTYELD